jgi:hypothetical protein
LAAFAATLLALVAAPPAYCGPYFYTYVITPRPNWGLGSPQPVKVFACTWFAAGNCGGLENEEGVALETTRIPTFGGYTVDGDSFAQEAINIVGSDVSIPNAYWLFPEYFVWTGGPAAGGALYLFNSRSNGVYYADTLMVFDPPNIDTIVLDFSQDLGSLYNTLPAAQTVTPNADGTIPFSLPGFAETPEPSFLVLAGPLIAALAGVRRKFARRSAPR